MNARLVHRPVQATQPLTLGETHELETPPFIDQDGGKANLLRLVPFLGAAISMTVITLFCGSPLAAVGALMMIVTVLASVVLLFTKRGKTSLLRNLCHQLVDASNPDDLVIALFGPTSGTRRCRA